jgi:prevent-host-death family protein
MSATKRISLTEAKQRLGELVKRAAYGGERFVLEFRDKPQAALVSYEDLERLENGNQKADREEEALRSLRALRSRMRARTDQRFDSVADVERVRQERTDELTGLR